MIKQIILVMSGSQTHPPRGRCFCFAHSWEETICRISREPLQVLLYLYIHGPLELLLSQSRPDPTWSGLACRWWVPRWPKELHPPELVLTSSTLSSIDFSWLADSLQWPRCGCERSQVPGRQGAERTVRQFPGEVPDNPHPKCVTEEHHLLTGGAADARRAQKPLGVPMEVQVGDPFTR